MSVLKNPLTIPELKQMGERLFGDMVKAVVDTERELLSVDAELHADLESLMLQQGSKQGNLWGINLYPAMRDEDFVEFDSMINVRPSQGNKSRSVESKETQEKILRIVKKWIKQ